VVLVYLTAVIYSKYRLNKSIESIMGVFTRCGRIVWIEPGGSLPGKGRGNVLAGGLFRRGIILCWG